MSQSTAIAQRPVDSLRSFLEKPAAQKWLQKQAAGHIARDAAGLINVVVQAASQTPLLAQCTPTSILAALIQSAQIGLVPNTRLNHSWLVPFKNRRQVGAGKWENVYEATLIIGYEGLIKLVYDATQAAVMARVVYGGDEFIYDLANASPVRRHVYADAKQERGEITHAYCLVTLPNGSLIGDVLDERMVAARRASSRSAASESSPWKTHKAPMYRKTAVRHTLPLVPKGPAPRLERALEIEAQDDATLAWGGAQVDVPQELAGELEELDGRAAESQKALRQQAEGSALADMTGAPSPEEVARAEAADREEQARRERGRRS